VHTWQIKKRKPACLVQAVKPRGGTFSNSWVDSNPQIDIGILVDFENGIPL
jgi:hypothetical protein